jgi:hypothetical protein
MKEYGMLIEFPNHLYRVYFPLKDDKVVLELLKLLIVPYLTKFLEKNASGLKWKLLEAKLEMKKSEHGFMMERDKLIALGIFGLMLFQNLTSVISLEAVIVFKQYENTQINLVAIILAETILTFSHCKRNENGALRCST